MDNDRLEILMGRFFDGEIEPSEERLLETQLAKDAQSRRLFEEFQSLHAMAQAEIAPLADMGRTFENVFAAAWKRSRRGQRRFVNAPVSVLRFISGMAAGLLLTIAIQYAMRPPAQSDTLVFEPTPRVQREVVQADGPDRILMRAAGDSTSPIIKDVDYYYYTDETGQRWLIEGYRENITTQLVSYQDL